MSFIKKIDVRAARPVGRAPIQATLRRWDTCTTGAPNVFGQTIGNTIAGNIQSQPAQAQNSDWVQQRYGAGAFQVADNGTLDPTKIGNQVTTSDVSMTTTLSGVEVTAQRTQSPPSFFGDLFSGNFGNLGSDLSYDFSGGRFFGFGGTQASSSPAGGSDGPVGYATPAMMQAFLASGSPAHWSIAPHSNAVMNPLLTAKATAVANAFYQQTGQNIVINSGYRGPQSQANAMFLKFNLEGNKTYPGPAGKQVYNTYLSAKENGLSDPEVISAMTSTIQNQVDNKVYVSKHLSGLGMDFKIQTNGVMIYTPAQIVALKAAIVQAGGRVLPESAPPHIHGSF